ncbi:uncharacterized protein LOC123542656 [Mercenaria mercenaria]|uniref:uncharacterized protein LOC123542656 n=1 Tax=Mercenaria mercenaria TaxID=6596 RepID=UPI00234EE59B|nr:uncharacterized protein LOC123542656 [Mercenaria mercenaria]
MLGVRNFRSRQLLCYLLSVGLAIILLISNYLTGDVSRLKRKNEHDDVLAKDSEISAVKIESMLITEGEKDVQDIKVQLNKEDGAIESTKDVSARTTMDMDRDITKLDNLTVSAVTQELGVSKSDVLSIARNISLYNKAVMVTVVNDAFLPFANSWLCNTKDMGIHKSVLIITGDHKSKENLTQDWPAINVFVSDIGTPKGNQEYSHVGYIKILIRRTEIILSLLLNNIDVLLFEFDYTWFANPLVEFQAMTDVDMLVNPVSVTEGIFNGGLVYLFATERTQSLWRQLNGMMVELGDRVKNEPDDRFIPETENDQQYLSRLVNQRFGDIRIKVLPLDKYSDGMWYKLTASERNKTHPILISNNWIIGNKNKIARAKEWRHWFVKENGSCDNELVRKTVYT